MFNPFGAKTYNLSGSISSTATSITLSSFLEPVTNTPYTFAILNTDIVYATISPKTTSSEFISFTSLVQNANGTCTLGGVTRGLNKKYPFTSDASFKLPHSGQSQFIISDAPQLFKKYGTLANDEVITGLWEAPNPSTSQGIVTNAYMLALINGGAVTFNSVTEAATAGETVAVGNLVYFSEVDNEWLKTDADTLATVLGVKLGIALGSGTNGNPISGGVLTFGSYTTSGLTQGDLLYASNTAGAINSGTAGTVPRVIGIAKSTTVMYFDPNFQNTLYNYAVDAVGTDSYAITLPGAFSAYYAGMQVVFKAGTANTGPATLAVNGGSAQAIKKAGTNALETGDIASGQAVLVEYDGTNFQLLSAFTSLASTTVAGRVEQATPAEVNAGTAAGGTGAQLFINPADLPAKNLIGALSNTIAKTYFNLQLLFILWTGAVLNDTTTTLPNWVRTSTDINVTPGGAQIFVNGTGADAIAIATPLFYKDNTTSLQLNATNIVVMDWWAILPTTSTGDINMGFATTDTDSFLQVYNENSASAFSNRVQFNMRGSTGVMYASIGKASVGITNTDISSGLTMNVWNNYRIELDLSNNALFYVNGVLKATLSGTNLPTTATAMIIGFGRSNTAAFAATAPTLSLEMNP